MSEERINQLKKFLEEDPEDAFSAFAIGLEWLKMKELENARKAFETLLNNQPEYLASYYQLGKLYEKLKLSELAIQTLKCGMELAQRQNNRHTFNELKAALDNLSLSDED